MKNKIFQLLLVLVSVFGFLIFFYGDLIFHPNDYLTTAEGDGIKAFYVYADHIKNDSSYHQLRNMNYPYGQTHIFTDGQTGIANILKYLSEKDPFFETHSIGIYNLLMILSFLGCAFFTCLILQRLNVSWWFIVLGSCSITFLSPQIFRILGHPTLSYTVFFPASWWLLIKFFESDKKILFTFLMIANSVFWFFVHPYYVMATSIFYLAYWFVLILQRGRAARLKTGIFIHALLQISLPLIITRFYIHAVDNHLYRSENPGGIWENHASLNSVFAPTQGPFKEAFSFFTQGATTENQVWEGWSYIGLPAVFIAAFSIVKIFRYAIRRKTSLMVKPVLPSVLETSIWASILVLLFSMCYPFRLQMGFLLDWLPFIKQFRSLGRFTWIFYFVFTVYSVYTAWLVFRYFRSKQLRLLAGTFALLFFTIFIAEGISYHRNVSPQTMQSKNFFNGKYLNEDYLQVIDTVLNIKEKFQCLVPLPFYHVGTENFGKVADGSLLGSMIVSYWTDIPLLSSSAARSPIMEGKNIMQFFSPPFFKKEIEKDLPGRKPFLILYNHENLGTIEHYWLLRSKKFFQNNTFELWELPYDSVFKSTAALELEHFNTIKKNLKSANGFLCAEEHDVVMYKNFDSLGSPQVFSGTGAFKGIKKNFNFLIEKIRLNLQPGEDYVVSFWYYNRDELRTQNTCVIAESDSAGQNEKWDIIFSPTESMTIDGDWSLVEKKFSVKNENESISVFLIGDKRSKQEFYVDDFLLRRANADVYKVNLKEGSEEILKMVKNNIPVFGKED